MKLLANNQNKKNHKVKVMIALLLTLLLQTPFALAKQITSPTCDGVKGLKVFSDYTPEGTPFIRKVITNLFNAFDDDHNFNHLIIDTTKFKSGNIEITFETLNKENKPIKKTVLKNWITDKKFPNQKISKIAVSKIIKNNLSQLHDKYINLTKEQKANTNMTKIPFNGKFYISQKNKPAFCIFDFKYAYKYQ